MQVAMDLHDECLSMQDEEHEVLQVCPQQQSPETATHAVDFGPGGLGGIGPLTARNLEGRGVCVIVLSEKGKNGAELFASSGVKYKDWWSKKWTPKLVKTW